MFPGNKNPNCFHLKCGEKNLKYHNAELVYSGSENRSRDFVRSYSKSEYEFNVSISK